MDNPNKCDRWFTRHYGVGTKPIVLFFHRLEEDLDPKFVTNEGVLRIHSRELINKWNESDAKFGISYSLEGDINA